MKLYNTDPPIEFTDYSSSRDAAEKLAYRLKRYWEDKGHPDIKFRVFNQFKGQGVLWAVRSNMVGGYPPHE